MNERCGINVWLTQRRAVPCVLDKGHDGPHSAERSSRDAASLRESLQQRAYPKLDRRKRRAVRRIFLFGLLHPDAMHHAIWGVNDALEGLPKDLARVLRDPTITIPRDHEIKLADGRSLFDHLQEWRNAPSNTASGGTDV